MLITLHDHLGSPPVFSEVRVVHALVFWIVCVFFVFVLLLVCPMLPVSLGCSFTIVRSVFVFYKKQELLTRREHMSSSLVFQLFNHDHIKKKSLKGTFSFYLFALFKWIHFSLYRYWKFIIWLIIANYWFFYFSRIHIGDYVLNWSNTSCASSFKVQMAFRDT
jgi:hypothetical protein